MGSFTRLCAPHSIRLLRSTCKLFSDPVRYPLPQCDARWIPLSASMTAAVPAAFIVRGINHLIATGAAAPATATVGSG